LGLDHLADHLRAAAAPSTGSDVRSAAARVAEVDLDHPLGDVKAALAEMSQVYLDDAIWFHDPAYVAHLNCPIVIPALLAELYVSAVNSSLDTWDQSIGGTHIEQRLIDWTADRIGFGPTADGVFTSGGTQSNLQALLLARAEVDARPDRLRIFASAEAHFSIRKAAVVLGLGPDAVVEVPTDSRRMDPGALARELEGARRFGLVPMAVVATAGTTDFGSIDPLSEVADVCTEHGVWLHVDAAYGGGLLASTRRRHLLAGIEQAASVAIDYHKTFFQPISASVVIVRDGDTLRHVTHHADYLNPQASVQPNQVDKSLQTTRRFDALKLWLTLRIMGADAVGEMFDRAIDLAHELHTVLATDPDFEVAATPTLSTLVFRYRPRTMSAHRADELAPAVRAEVFRSGRAVIAGTRVDGESWLKVTLLNPAATLEGLTDVVEEIRRTARALESGAAQEAS
jgi:L-2,4-diaminobutyrate decarboxylase